MNMLNRETPAGEQQQQVNNLNIQDQSSQLADDHPMRGDTDAESEEDPPVNETNMAIEASNIPLPTDDDSDDSDSTDEDTEDEDEHDDEGAVGGTPAATTAPTDPAHPPSESADATETVAESATGGGFITDMDPAVRAILGELEVPEGVDPSFLAALPQEMRDEVIQEHVR